MKKAFVVCLFAVSLILYACGDGGQKEGQAGNDGSSAPQNSESAATNPSYDPERGSGKFSQVDIPARLDAALASNGEKVYSVKCSGCHKLTEEKLVGPGWKGVTQRHKPEWILNFVTNTDEMITKDPKAQAQLELCMVRMPNQNLSEDDARHVYEYMRQNDGVK